MLQGRNKNHHPLCTCDECVFYLKLNELRKRHTQSMQELTDIYLEKIFELYQDYEASKDKVAKKEGE